MAQAVLYSKTGSKKDTAVTLPAKIFGVEPNHSLINSAYQLYLANGRLSGAKTLTRGEVRGGGKKPWKQKGTGRARAGSSRLPHWTGGGVAFGPVGTENHTKTMPLKAKRTAIRHALSLQASDKKLLILEDFVAPEGKVSTTVNLLAKLEAEGAILIVVAAKDPLIDRATRNMAGVSVVGATYLNVFTILNADVIIMTQAALDQIKQWLGGEKPGVSEDKPKPPVKPAAKQPSAKKTEAKA